MPEIQTYFQAGGLVDSVMNQGLPAPLDIQISSNDQRGAFDKAQEIAQQLRGLSSVGDVYIPQDLKYPGLELNIDRERASLVGLSPKDVVDNVITALTSNGVIAPSYWIDPEHRQQLHAHRPVLHASDRAHEHGGVRKYSSARQGADRLHAAALSGLHETDRHAHRGGSLRAAARDRYLCAATFGGVEHHQPAGAAYR